MAFRRSMSRSRSPRLGRPTCSGCAKAGAPPKMASSLTRDLITGLLGMSILVQVSSNTLRLVPHQQIDDGQTRLKGIFAGIVHEGRRRPEGQLDAALPEVRGIIQG